MNKHTSLMQRSWTWLLRNFMLPLGDVAFGQRMMQRLRYLEDAQWWDKTRLYQKRDEDLRTLLKIAYEEVPLYNHLFTESGLLPSDIKSAHDLRKLPVVTKDMLREGYPEQTTRSTKFKTRVAHTSGSTGKNLRVLEDSDTTGWYRAAFMLALTWSGWELGVPQLQTGMSLNRTTQKKIKDSLLRCHYVSAFDLTDSHLDIMLDILEKHKIQYLWGYPGSLYYVAKRAQEVGWNRPLLSVVTWGDNLFPHYRKMIETAFQTRVFDTYGCAEGIQISAQCEEMNYHIHTLDTVVEFVDEDNNPVSCDQSGRLILTRLHPGTMPLIRYRVGDIGIAGENQVCHCGREFDLMASIQGRDTDVILTPSGNRLIVHFFTGILEYFPEIVSFQAVQEEEDIVLLRIVPAPEYSAEVGQEVVSRLWQKGAADLKFEIELVDDIPLPPTGKRRFVINHFSKKSI